MSLSPVHNLQASNPPRFQSNAVAALIRKAAPWQQPLLKLVNVKEGTHGVSWTTFIQDVSASWMPQALARRSQAELNEDTIKEFTESFFVYFGIPLSAQHVFSKIMAPNLPNARALMATPIKRLARENPQVLKSVIPAKAATVLSAWALCAVAGEYSLQFFKNLLTEKVFHKSNFSDVVNLSSDTIAHDEVTPYSKRAKRRIKQVFGVAAGLIGASFLMSRFGANSKALSGISHFITKNFDFKYKGSYGLTHNLNWAFIAVAFTSYLDAARDSLERKEILTRVGLIMPYLGGGQQLLENLLTKPFTAKLPELLKVDPATTGKLDAILKSMASNPDKLNKIEKLFGFGGSKDKLSADLKDLHFTLEDLLKNNKLPLAKRNRQIKSLLGADGMTMKSFEEIAASSMSTAKKLKLAGTKLSHFLTALLIGVFGVAFGIISLSRYWTKVRFHRQEASKAQTQIPAQTENQSAQAVSQTTPDRTTKKPNQLSAVQSGPAMMWRSQINTQPVQFKQPGWPAFPVVYPQLPSQMPGQMTSPIWVSQTHVQPGMTTISSISWQPW